MTNTITSESLEQLLRWSAPITSSTARGIRQVRTASPHAGFWGIWRSQKTACQELGISPKLEGDKWIIRWYQEPPAPDARPFTLPETKYAWSDEQISIFRWFHSGTGSIVVRARAGTGKCLGAGTPVLMFNGTVKPVEAIRNGDLLMGPDSKPRRVIDTCTGRGPLVRIVPVKGSSWICNDVHVLTLAGSNHKMGQVIDVPVNELPANYSRSWKLFKPAHVNFPQRSLPAVDPYFFGLWIGDGTKEVRTRGLAQVAISKPDPEIYEACKAQAKTWGLGITTRTSSNGCPTHSLTTGNCLGLPRTGKNPLLNAMRKMLGLNLTIPDSIRFGSAHVRLEFLAGVLDTDGHLICGGYEIAQKHSSYAETIAFIARSLGIAVSQSEKIVEGQVYQRLFLSGHVAKLPLRISRKQAPVRRQVKDALKTGFTVKSIGAGAYFGFTLDGDGRFLLGDFTVTHNTTTIKAAFTLAREERMLYAVFNKKNQVEATAAITDHRVEIKTLHSVGFMFIQQVWPNARPTDEVESFRVEKAVGEQNPKEVKTQVKKLVAFAKNTLINPTLYELVELAEDRDIECPQFEAPENGGWDRIALSRAALQVLELSKVRDELGRISFNDMVWLPCAMNWTRAWFDLVVIDEAQDMNLPQLTMARAACKHGGRICVVGDDRQAIYGFRGAVSDGMDMMRKALNAQELGLTITYRCPRKVVALAANIVPDYKAADAAPEGEVLDCEATSIHTQVTVGDAILSRSNAPLMDICLSLLRKGIPARIEGRDLGKALLDIVSKLNARSVPDFLRKVEHWTEKQTNRFMDTRNFEEKATQIQDQAQTLTAIAEGASSVTEIEHRLNSLFSDTDASSKPSVVLSTTHKAKGLEWTKVYLLVSTFNKKRPTGAPHLSPEAEAARAKEEANIYYVALTRSKMSLVLATGGTK